MSDKTAQKGLDGPGGRLQEPSGTQSKLYHGVGTALGYKETEMKEGPGLLAL